LTAGMFGHWVIGYLAHNHGKVAREVRGAAVQGRNVRLASLLTMGECWHNNHHAFPGSARLGLAPGEWDPGWWVLLGLKHLGLVWALRLPEDLPHRPELVQYTDCSHPRPEFRRLHERDRRPTSPKSVVRETIQ
jgi:stearoyl-CoA desaturase (delta-9 desaturase)